MLKSNDLMVGDFILHKNKVHKIKEVCTEFIVSENSSYLFICYDEIEPVVLTTEILQKIGFIQDLRRKWLFKTPFGLYHMGSNIFKRLNTKITYLHELQQLIRIILKEEIKISPN